MRSVLISKYPASVRSFPATSGWVVSMDCFPLPGRFCRFPIQRFCLASSLGYGLRANSHRRCRA